MARPPNYNDQDLPEGLHGEFCATMRKLADKHGLGKIVELLDTIDIKKPSVYHAVSGRSMPKINDLPKWASALGLKNWRAFFKS